MGKTRPIRKIPIKSTSIAILNKIDFKTKNIGSGDSHDTTKRFNPLRKYSNLKHVCTNEIDSKYMYRTTDSTILIHYHSGEFQHIFLD